MNSSDGSVFKLFKNTRASCISDFMSAHFRKLITEVATKEKCQNQSLLQPMKDGTSGKLIILLNYPDFLCLGGGAGLSYVLQKSRSLTII